MTFPYTSIKLYNCNFLDKGYQHTLMFNTLSEQTAFFNGKQVFEMSNSSYQKMDDKIRINRHKDDLQNCNYLSFDNKGKVYYAFITSIEYENEKVSFITYEIDVIQSYLLDWKLKESYVDRCHVPRWNGNTPSKEIVDEGIDFGTHVIEEREKLITYTNEGTVICATSPLGKVKVGGHGTGGGGGGGGGGGEPSEAGLSAKGYRFLKGFEGFGKYPYRVVGETADTAGYGIREDFQKQYFELLKPFPCSEKLASSVLGTMLIKAFIEPVERQLKADGITSIKQNIKDVWVSHSMNAGFGAWSGGTPYKMFKQGASASSIADAIKKWYIYGEGGVILEGLVERRNQEADIYLNGKYTMRSIVTINRDGSYGPPVTDNNGNGYIPPEFGKL